MPPRKPKTPSSKPAKAPGAARRPAAAAKKPAATKVATAKPGQAKPVKAKSVSAKAAPAKSAPAKRVAAKKPQPAPDLAPVAAAKPLPELPFHLVAVKAYEIWEAKMREANDSVRNWLEAEAELRKSWQW